VAKEAVALYFELALLGTALEDIALDERKYDLNTTITVHKINTGTHTRTHTVNTIEVFALFFVLTSTEHN